MLAVVAVAVGCVAAFYAFASALLSRARPEVGYLEVSALSVEVLHAGPELEVVLGGGEVFRARYVYRVTAVVHNVGTQPIEGLEFEVVDADPHDGVTVCESDACQVYDPLALDPELPERLGPNRAAQVVLVVLSKVDLAELAAGGRSPILVEVEGALPDGTRCRAYLAPFGGGR